MRDGLIYPAGEAPAPPSTVCQIEPCGSDDTGAGRLHNHRIPNRALPPGRHGGSIRYSCSVHWTSLAQADSALTHLPSLHVATIVVSIPRARRPRPQTRYTKSGVAARTTRGLDTVFLFSPLDFTRSGRLSAYAPAFASRRHNRRLRNRGIYPAGEAPASPNTVCQIEPCGSDDTGARYGILVQSTGLHSLRQTQCFAPAFASRRHNRRIHNRGILSRGRGARVPSGKA